MREDEYWKKMYERTVLERNKALFTIGWLISCLENEIGKMRANQAANEGKAEAEKYYKTVNLMGEKTWEASAPMV